MVKSQKNLSETKERGRAFSNSYALFLKSIKKVPNEPAMRDAKRTANFDLLFNAGSLKASELIKRDIVKPMPAIKPISSAYCCKPIAYKPMNVNKPTRAAEMS